MVSSIIKYLNNILIIINSLLTSLYSEPKLFNNLQWTKEWWHFYITSSSNSCHLPPPQILHVRVDCFKAMKSDTCFVLHLCLLHSSDDADHKKYSTLNNESRRCYMSIYYSKNRNEICVHMQYAVTCVQIFPFFTQNFG